MVQPFSTWGTRTGAFGHQRGVTYGHGTNASTAALGTPVTGLDGEDSRTETGSDDEREVHDRRTEMSPSSPRLDRAALVSSAPPVRVVIETRWKPATAEIDRPVREWAVRSVFEQEQNHESQWAAIVSR